MRREAGKRHTESYARFQCVKLKREFVSDEKWGAEG
jgi:hypothetical protein